MSHDFLKREEFLQQAEFLFDAFPAIKSRSRIERMFLLSRELNKDALKEIFECMVDTLRTTPTPEDFKKAVTSWKLDYYRKHGKYYGHEKSEHIDPCLECATCFDTGILKIEHHDSSDFSSLMRCMCSTGKSNANLLPQWDNSLGGAFKKLPLNDKWFNPQVGTNDTDSQANSKIMKKVNQWKAKIIEAEKYWFLQGYRN